MNNELTALKIDLLALAITKLIQEIRELKKLIAEMKTETAKPDEVVMTADQWVERFAPKPKRRGFGQ